MMISEALEERLRNAATPEEAVRACAEAGIPITAEQLKPPVPSGPDGELSEAALDNVSGGGILDWIRRWYHTSRTPSGSGGGGGCSW
ncbi:MAG: hypothetical protein SPI15_01970 [Candidatus Faecousia sp.]|nr:hypothetical protein [Clostridiales bacterium]MDY6179595.1 hypothetical protein [Candidatus Faecousia sp.]